jgi:hypothetical protein
MKIKQRKNNVPKPDLWKYKEAENEYYIEQFNIENTIELYDKKYVGLVFVGDAHFGGKGVDMRRAREHAQLISKHKNVYVLLGGDMTDNFVRTKILSAIVNKTTAPREEHLLFERYLSWLGDNALLAVGGNHEGWSKQIAGIDLFRSLYKRHQIAYSQYDFKIDLRCGKMDYFIYMRHKYKYRSVYNNTHGIQAHQRNHGLGFDVGVGFHYHTYAVSEYMWGDPKKKRIAVQCGSYKVADVYAREIAVGQSTPIMPMIIFNPDKRDMIVHKDLESGLKHLSFLNK